MCYVSKLSEDMRGKHCKQFKETTETTVLQLRIKCNSPGNCWTDTLRQLILCSGWFIVQILRRSRKRLHRENGRIEITLSYLNFFKLSQFLGIFDKCYGYNKKPTLIITLWSDLRDISGPGRQYCFLFHVLLSAVTLEDNPYQSSPKNEKDKCRAQSKKEKTWKRKKHRNTKACSQNLCSPNILFHAKFLLKSFRCEKY